MNGKTYFSYSVTEHHPSIPMLLRTFPSPSLHRNSLHLQKRPCRLVLARGSFAIKEAQRSSGPPAAADAVVVGGGIAGLACALKLSQANMTPILIEAADDLGGRVRSDRLEGFIL